MTDTAKPANAGVYFPPPFIFVGGLLAAWLLETRFHAIPLSTGVVPSPLLRGVGCLFVAMGLAIGAWGIITFKRAHTAIIPHKAASSLVETGPYAFTRNPMYTGMTVLYFGAGLILNSTWAFLLLPVVLLLLYRFVISREERYLSAEFGEDYAAYRARVKRWI